MGTSLAELTQGARAAAKLQEQLSTGDHVVSIDTSTIDPSPIADRLPTENDPGFDELVDSILVHGQQVPILVRPHPVTSGRFQIAYGRRRLRALEKAGLPAKAIVRNLTDDELIVAQGRENLDRADLSFIEKALFAMRLEDAGYDRTVIMSALSTGKADLSRYISVARRVPQSLVQRIGPARKAGRARWTAMVEALDAPSAEAGLAKVLASSAFGSADSDSRFTLVLKALAAAPAKSKNTSAWNTPAGRRAVRIETKKGHTAITFDNKHVPEFASFVADRLDALYQEFSDQQGRDESDS
jgi:ParB family chromosome partitioning protein